MTQIASRWIDGLPASSRDRFVRLGTVQTAAAGESVIRKGAAETHLFLVEDGELEVVLDGSDRPVVGAANLVGEMAFLDNAPRRNDVRARTDCRLRRLDRLELMTAFASDPRELRDVLDAIAALQATRLSTAAGDQQSAARYVAGLAGSAAPPRRTAPLSGCSRRRNAAGHGLGARRLRAALLRLFVRLPAVSHDGDLAARDTEAPRGAS